MSARRVIPRVKDIPGKLRNKAKRLASITPKLKFYYWYFCRYCKVKPNRMLFESFHGKGISDSTYAVLQHMMATGQAEQYEIYYATNDIARDQPFVERNHLPIKLVDINTRRYVLVLATAKYLLNNSSFPLYFILRDEQTYVQTWHGTPLKTLGKEMRLGIESMVNVQHNFLQATWLTFPNDFTRDVIMRDYNLDQLYTGKVAMVGYPRNTVFLTGSDPDIRARYDLDGYTTYAYMPTWRGKSNHDVEISLYADQISAMLHELDARLSDSQRMFVNFHSMVASQLTLDSYEHIFPFPSNVGTYDFLSQLDVLVTDYSSVMFDYALTGRPVVLYTYDEEQYLADRGMYFPMSELPFTQVKTVDELASCLNERTYGLDAEDLAAFASKYLSYDSPKNSQHVLDLLLGTEPKGVPILDYAANLNKTWTLVDVEPQRTSAQLNAIFLSTGPDDLVVINRAGFGPGKSALVYDNYRDRTFIFRTKTTPRTYLEDVTRRFWPPAIQRLDSRERRRLVGKLTTAPDITRSALVGLPETAYSQDRQFDVKGAYKVVGSQVVASFEPEGMVPRKVLLITGRTIRWSRDLTTDEARDCRVALDVQRPVCSPLYTCAKGNSMRVSILLEDQESNQAMVGNIMLGAGDTGRNASVRYGTSIPLDAAYIARMRPVDMRGKSGWNLLDKANGRALCCVPYENVSGRLSLMYTYAVQAGRSFYKVRTTSVKTPNERTVVVDMHLEGGAPRVLGVELHNRLTSSDTCYAFDVAVREHRDSLSLRASFDPAGRTYDGIYWDLCVVVADEASGQRYELPSAIGRLLRGSFYVRNLQCVLGDGNVLFPYFTRGKRPSLAFIYRPLHASDTLGTAYRELAAMAIYLLFGPILRRRKVWLVYEKYSSLAQDNGFAFFEYCMQRDDIPKDHRIFYVMDKSSPEYEKVLPYKKNVLDFMGFQHMLYLLISNIYVGSDAKSHLYQWRPKPSLINQHMADHEVFFLQHGVTALKRVDYLFGRRGSNPMTYFLTTSHAEQDIITANFGYNVRHSPVLGFSRWDWLRDSSDKNAPTILCMPTWRQWLEGVGDDVFLQSEYYQRYSELIQSKELEGLLERSNATLKFFIHPKFSEQIRHFGKTSDRVELIDMGSCPLNELIMECSMLITDYSSVCWDVLYMNKPVIYYHFDQDRYVDEVGSYIDLNIELPGDVCKTFDELLQAMESIVERSFELDEAARKVARRWFDFRDQNNRKRTYEFLLGEGY